MSRYTRLERWLGIERAEMRHPSAPPGYRRPKVNYARSTKMRIYREQQELCYICLTPMTMMPEQTVGAPQIQPRDTDATWDHIHPLVLGGDNKLSNMALAHDLCNTNKGHLPSVDLTTPEDRDLALAFHVFIIMISTLQPLRRVL